MTSTGSRAANIAAVSVDRRVWLLLLLEAVERADLAPIAGHQLHRMVYLANCLSPLYDVPVADGEILKYRRGPFYPDLQWDLDRLVGMRLLAISDVRLLRESGQPAWLFARYGIEAHGLTLVTKALQASERARERHSFYVEVAGAYAALDENAQDGAALQDANFQNPKVQPETVIDFSEWSQNVSLQAANTFNSFAPRGRHLTERDKLHLYFRYLNRMDEKAAG